MDDRFLSRSSSRSKFDRGPYHPGRQLVGFFSKLFGLSVVCDRCGKGDAKDSWQGIRCRNPSCAYFDRSLSTETATTSRAALSAGDNQLWYAPISQLPWPANQRNVEFDETVTIRYINTAGISRTFESERASLIMRGSRLSARIQPTGGRISLAPEKIQNWDEVDESIRRLKPDFSQPVELVYVNFRNETRHFQVARNFLRTRGDRVSVCAAPQGVTLSLKIDRIQNWSEAESRFQTT